jgi:hypothetical protein
VLAWTLRPIWDIDIFMHIAIGREVFAHGLPTTDVLSAATPDAPWTPFQVGYELLVAALDEALGLYGVNLLHSVAIAVAFVWMRRRLSELTSASADTTESARTAATLLLLALLFVTFEARVRPRPHVVNLVFEALILLPLASGRLWIGDRRAFGWLFLLGALWSALHAMGALWLVAVLGTFCVAGHDAPTRKWGFIATLCALLGVLVVPGSAAGIVHVLSVQDQWKEFVPELLPSWALVQLGPSGALAFACSLAAVFCALAAWRCQPARARYPVLLSALGLALSSLWLARLVYYAPLAIALVWTELAPRVPHFLLRVRTARIAAAVIALVLLVELAPRYLIPGVVPWTTTLHPGAFPVEEMRALSRAGITGKAFNQAKWGGYILYTLYPSLTVMSDGRATFGPEVAEILRRERDTPPEVVADVAHARFGIDLLIWRRGRMLPNDHWQLIAQGPVADVFSRTGPLLEQRKAALARLGSSW